MAQYVVRRLAFAVLTVVGVMLLVFVLTHVIGNPVDVLLPLDASSVQKALLRHQLGLDRPILVQLYAFFAAILHGDLGNSWRQNIPAMQVVWDHLPLTVELVLSAFLLAVPFGIGLGTAAAHRAGSWVDRSLSAFWLSGICFPNFWVGIMLILIFGVALGWLPTSGSGGIRHLILPAVTLALLPAGQIAQITRSALLDCLRQQYVTTARSKGVVERRVLLSHALKNAMIPVVTMIGFEFARSLAGYTVAVEVVFGWLGIGDLIIDTIGDQDFPVLTAIALVVAVVIALINLLVDLSYTIFDPSVRY